jgi:hypothetical protein
MTIHAQEGKSYADCLKQSWKTSRILTQEKPRPSQPTKPANNEATVSPPIPIGELVNKVIQFVEVGLAEIEPVKTIAAAEKKRQSVENIFGELIKASSKKETEAKSLDTPKPRAIPKGKKDSGHLGQRYPATGYMYTS